MSSMDKLAKELKTMMTASDDRKPKPYDTQAEVLRVEDGVAWVHIPGGVQETPVRLTMNAKKGDMVNVRVASGSAWITGNGTNPPTDDTTANIANDTASKAMSIGEMAMSDAERARVAADSAEAEANRARETAEGVKGIATRAEGYAENAQASADSASRSAETAITQLGIVEDVVGVLDLLSNKAEYRESEDEEVQSGKWYFMREGTSPNYLYHVVNPSPQSVYHLTEDTAIDSTKTYYTRSGTGTEEDPYVYTDVENPVVADIGTYYEKYYEMVSINASVKDYITSRLVVTGDGLTIQDPSMQTRILLSPTDGVVLTGVDGAIVGKYGETAQIGDAGGFHIDMGVWYKLTEDVSIVPNKDYYTRSGIDPNYTYTKVDNPVLADIGTYYEQMPAELGFYEKSKKVAYINNDQLYITKTVVLQQMQLGTPVAQGGADALGQWSWKVHPNKQTPRRNNLNLKWNG